MAKRQRMKLLYILIAIIIILAAAFTYTLYQAKSAPTAKVTSSSEASKIQQDVTKIITNIRSTLEEINKSLGG